MVRPLVVISAAIICGFSSACSSAYHARTAITIAHHSTRITLSHERPLDAQIGIALVSIAADGTTAIRVVATGRIIRASPGGYYVGPEFGGAGLRLISASRQTRTAVLERTYASYEPVAQPSNQAMQLTASKPAIYASRAYRRASMLRGMHRGLAAADLLARYWPRAHGGRPAGRTRTG